MLVMDSFASSGSIKVKTTVTPNETMISSLSMSVSQLFVSSLAML